MNTTAPVFAKYIVVLLPDNTEQAVRFPSSKQHAQVARELALPVISAGFCMDSDWTGGESESLKIGSRKKDLGILCAMLRSPARETYDLMPEELEPQTFDLDTEPAAPAISFP